MKTVSYFMRGTEVPWVVALTQWYLCECFALESMLPFDFDKVRDSLMAVARIPSQEQ